MRRLKASRSGSEGGAAGVLVAILMLVLLGAGALAVDVGQIYAERAQLQNGADAAALAVARTCADGSCDDAVAGPLANSNANDHLSDAAVDATSVPGQVTVTTTTRNGSGSFLANLFANALPNPPAITVGAKATATWSVDAAAGAFPLVFDQCQIGVAYAPKGVTVLMKEHGKSPCVGSPSGHHIPGGFGWLDDTGACDVAADATGWVGSNPGNSKTPPSCGPTLDSWRSQIDFSKNQFAYAFFPIFEDGQDNGIDGKFHLSGYARVQIHGWSFVKDSDNLAGLKADPVCTLLFKKGVDRGICGQYVEFIPWSLRSSEEGPYFQNSVVKLIK
ncbi:TadE/TadG family type IV pilus assembly protein [Arthrobacter sp. OAP107]|uniref:TadE/TadG family type IV pilus assembly protein n=1 Tax=Arthrobacter sp. OAP107 TaxID=3156445 RepID=UPI003397AFC2